MSLVWNEILKKYVEDVHKNLWRKAEVCDIIRLLCKRRFWPEFRY